MEYRKLPHGEEQISILGLGASSIGASGDKEIRATAELAMEKGINFFDMASADAAPFAAYGAAMAGRGTKSISRSISAPTTRAANTAGPRTWTPSNGLSAGSWKP